jgi:hypothetical protein
MNVNLFNKTEAEKYKILNIECLEDIKMTGKLLNTIKYVLLTVEPPSRKQCGLRYLRLRNVKKIKKIYIYLIRHV